MIVTLKSPTRKQFFKAVIEYYAAWGIPADETGRTDRQKNLSRSSSNPGAKSDIPDDKFLSVAKEGYNILLHKMACDGVFGFDIFLARRKQHWGEARFINEKQIEILDITHHMN